MSVRRVPECIPCLALCLSLAIPIPVHAGLLDNATVALRVGPAVPSAKACLPENTGVGDDCHDFPTRDPDVGPGIARYYLIVTEALEGVGGLSLGIRYGDCLAVTFDLCTDGLEFTNNGWPESGGGNRITWTTCPAPDGLQAVTNDGIHVCFGSFYVYKYGESTLFEITKNPLSPGPEDDELVVGNCSAVESPLSILAGGMIGIGTDGRNPCCCFDPPFAPLSPVYDCTPVPAAPVTWGRLKTRYAGTP